MPEPVAAAQPAPGAGSPPPSPGLFFETIQAFHRAEVLRGAIELDVFTAIGEGARTAAALAARVGAAERGVRILCDYLVVLGFLTKDAGGAYGPTPDTAVFLDRRSPAYAGGVTAFLFSDQIVGAYRRVADSVRRGGAAYADEGTVSAENPVWVDFARAMAPMMALPAERTAELVDPAADRPLSVLDVAAGHGLYGLAFARRNARARAVALDWPNVVAVARENAARMGLADRFGTIAGSAFEVDWGGRYDVVLLPNFLHHFDPPGCEALLRRARAALAPGGRAVIVEFVPNDDRVTPPMPATFAMTMLVSTPRGDAYTFAEYDRMLRTAGFAAGGELHELPPTFQRVVVARV